MHLRTHFSFLLSLFTILSTSLLGTLSEQVADLDDKSEFSIKEPSADDLRVQHFGEGLFQGNFSQITPQHFNPNYKISVGDEIQLQVWGATTLNLVERVDSHGNIFIPHVGPVKLLSVENQDLNKVIAQAISDVFASDVQVYGILTSAQPVSIFVSGFVKKPGLYQGVCSESVLSFIDRSGGIDPAKGSYLEVDILRDGEVIHTVNLYRFLVSGKIPNVQLNNGDVIRVHPKKSTVLVQGLVETPMYIEFPKSSVSLESILKIAQPLAEANQVLSLSKSVDATAYEKIDLAEAGDVLVSNGEVLTFTRDDHKKDILVSLRGAFMHEKESVFPYGVSLGDVLNEMEPREQANTAGLQLYRKSVAKEQKEMIEKNLAELERELMVTSPTVLDEAKIRAEEVKLLTQFIDQAKKVEPKGLVVVSNSVNAKDITLEDDDVLYMPTKNMLVYISGSVRIPSTFVYESSKSVADYIGQAGGFTKDADPKNILMISPGGETQLLTMRQAKRIKGHKLSPGNKIMVLPKVGGKSLILTQAVTDILYKVAIASHVVLNVGRR